MKTPALISSSTFLAFVNAHEKKKRKMRKKGKEKKRRREKVSEKKKRVHDMLIQDFPTVSPFFYTSYVSSHCRKYPPPSSSFN